MVSLRKDEALATRQVQEKASRRQRLSRNKMDSGGRPSWRSSVNSSLSSILGMDDDDVLIDDQSTRTLTTVGSSSQSSSSRHSCVARAEPTRTSFQSHAPVRGRVSVGTIVELKTKVKEGYLDLSESEQEDDSQTEEQDIHGNSSEDDFEEQKEDPIDSWKDDKLGSVKDLNRTVRSRSPTRSNSFSVHDLGTLKSSLAKDRMAQSLHFDGNRSVTFSDVVDTKDILKLEGSFDLLFYSDNELAEMRHKAFMEDCGLDPDEFG